METKWKVVLVTLVAGFIGFLFEANSPIGKLIWPAHLGGMQPTSLQLGLLIVVGIAEAIGFGLGVAFLMYGFPLVSRAAPSSRGLVQAAYVAIAWGLVSWVPHDSLHQHIGENLGALIAIEYGFHVTLIACGAVIAWFFIVALRSAAKGADSLEPAAASPQVPTAQR